jgi:Tfp pilus assembly protein PilF
VRITAQLSDVKDGFQLWSERYDREMKDIFDVQDEIAKAIAERLKVTLAGVGDGRLVAKATDNTEAYETYLRGRSLLLKRGRHMVQALEQFQKVVEIDPGYALAWAGIADVHSLMGFYGLVRPTEAGPRALTAAHRAVELDARSSEAHASLALAWLFYKMDPDHAGREFETALELSPHNTQARCWYGYFYLPVRGRFDEGMAEFRRALESDPLSAYPQAMLGIGLYTAGRIDEALTLARMALETDPDSFVAQTTLAHSLFATGRHGESVAAMEDSVRMSGDSAYANGQLAQLLSRAGRLSEAQALRQRLKDRALSEYIPFTHLAEAAFAAGDRDEALSLAQRACDEREPVFVIHARYAPTYEWLREQPEWPAMLRQLDEPPKTEP